MCTHVYVHYIHSFYLSYSRLGFLEADETHVHQL